MFVLVSVVVVTSRPSSTGLVLATDEVVVLSVEVKAVVKLLTADVVKFLRIPDVTIRLILSVDGVTKDVSNDFDVRVTSLTCSDVCGELFTTTSVCDVTVVSGVIRDVTLASRLSLNVDIV